MNRASKMIEYCRRDTEITGRFVKSMLSKYDEIGCELKTTIAATTLNYFEKNFGGKLTHSFEEEQIDFFHRGYYGGRSEIFHTAPLTGNIFYHDLNSLYPYAMKIGEFPRLEQFYETREIDLSLFGMAEVEVDAPKKLSIPYLSCKSEGKLLFPLGRWRGVYTYFELRQAKIFGYQILKTYRAIEFPSGFNPFVRFIDEIYAARLDSIVKKDDLMSLTYKAFMNYAYGKYAQRNESTELVPLSKLREIPDGAVIFGGELALIKKKIKYPRYANCIWACYITAIARDILYTNLIKTQKAGGLLLYCDTDSIVYESKKQILEDSRELGQFKLEGRFRYAHFRLPKLYKLIPIQRNRVQVYRAKGVPRKNAKRFFRNNYARFKRPNKLRETLRRNLSPKKKYRLIPNYWMWREKQVLAKYDKRLILPGGFTEPITLKREETENGKRKKKAQFGYRVP